MTRSTLTNPILNSPFVEPTQHFEFDEDGFSPRVEQGRRSSTYFVPIPQPKKGKPQLSLQGFEEKRQEMALVNRLRGEVSKWRQGGYQGTTRRTRHLLEHWKRPDRERGLFFCQLEAVETAIYLVEVAEHDAAGKASLGLLREAQSTSSPSLQRMAFKMATGSGKTVVMAMFIAWQTLNRQADPESARFSSNFLVVTPGITIRDRLQVLLPENPDNYYHSLDLVPADLLEGLGQARLVITNFHAFQQRELLDASALTKQIVTRGHLNQLRESDAQIVRRVCQGLDPLQPVLVLNDEAHHCYRARQAEGEKLTGDDLKEAKEREQQARLWLTGLEKVQKHFGKKGSAQAQQGKPPGAKRGISAVFDLSATPFFLRGSGYPEGTLFPWVVSDFSLVDAIEAGIVKVPRVPIADNSLSGDQPVYRDLWPRIREHLPTKRASKEDEGEPNLPPELEGALLSLYKSYEAFFRRWEQSRSGAGEGSPPVFIVVCSNTSVSKLVFRYISGYDKALGEGASTPVAGNLPLFSNIEAERWLSRPRTILVDSVQLEAGGLSDDFKRVAARELDEFKREYRRQYPGRDVENISETEILREVLNTVGKPGKLGGQVRCVVSVSMLTEGWDANTVTHILGVRAFSTQLLCEQVIGRGLRRVSYEPDEQGKFRPEYAEVYGVPFRFLPVRTDEPGATNDEERPRTRVRALPDRIKQRIVFPRVIGYRYELPRTRLVAQFEPDSQLALSTKDVPTMTELTSILGESEVHTLDHLRSRRPQEVAFWLTKRTLERYFRDESGFERAWLFPEVLAVARRWLGECVKLKDDTFVQLLLLAQHGHNAADKIYHAIVTGSSGGAPRLMPVLSEARALGSTSAVDFFTLRPVWPTRPEKSHVSHVVADTETWEQKLAQALEEMDEVITYVKNHGLDFAIPYTVDGIERRYVPDFLARIRHPELGPLTLILEGTGERRPDKVAKASTARSLWVPAVNNHGGYGQWAFVELTDPWDAKTCLRRALDELAHMGRGPVGREKPALPGMEAS